MKNEKGEINERKPKKPYNLERFAETPFTTYKIML